MLMEEKVEKYLQMLCFTSTNGRMREGGLKKLKQKQRGLEIQRSAHYTMHSCSARVQRLRLTSGSKIINQNNI